MEGKKCLCEHCVRWVDCDESKYKEYPWGFCLMKDLYTYTACKTCEEHTEGEPFTETEYEMLE